MSETSIVEPVRAQDTSVLIAHRYFWPDNISLYPAMLKDVAEWHRGQGHVTTVLAPRASSRDSQKVRDRWAATHEVNLREPALRGDRGLGVIGRIANACWYAYSLCKEIAIGDHSTVLVASYPPVLCAMLCRWMQLLSRFEYIYYVQDIYPEMIAQRGGWWRRLLGSLLKAIDRRNVRHSKWTITISAEMKQTLVARGEDADKIVVIPNFAIEDPIDRETKSPNKRPRLVFAGNIGALQNLEHFVRSAKLARERCDFEIEFVGGGAKLPALRDFATHERADWITFSGLLSRDEARARIDSADVGVVGAVPGLFDVAFPSKTNSYLLGGLPVLVFTEPDSPVSGWLDQHRFGVAASPSHEANAADSIVSLVRQIRSAPPRKCNLSQRAGRLLSKERYFKSYSALFPSTTETEGRKTMDYSNDRLRFDAEQFNFSALVLDEINQTLRARGHAEIASLAEIHRAPDIEENIEEYRQVLFTLFRKPHFQKVYRAFGKMLIDDHFTERALIQKTPTVRIHLPGGVSVSFHSDAWYGHGRRVCSFWLPLTRVWGGNSLQIARSIDESRAFLGGIAAERLDLDEINTLAAELCSPIDAGHGDLIVFNADMVHGTISNTTESSRVSFDFRIAESVEEIGTKPASNFYTRQELDGPIASDKRRGARKRRSALMYSGICRGVSAKSQLVFLNEYAKINAIDIAGSESEIVVFDYCPVLKKYVKTPHAGTDCILLFSVDLLPKDKATRSEIYKLAIANKIEMVFGAEGISIVSDSDVGAVEDLLSLSTTHSAGTNNTVKTAA